MKIGIEKQQMILTQSRFDELNALRVNGRMPNHSVLATEAKSAAYWLAQVATLYGKSDKRRLKDVDVIYEQLSDLQIHLGYLIDLMK
jgi:hypothetical protein